MKSRRPMWLGGDRHVPMLDMSTCHIEHKDAKVLDYADNLLVVHKYPEGFFVVVPEGTKTRLLPADTRRALHKFGYSAAMTNLLSICLNQGYQLIRLDCDGQVYDQLPKFDW